MTLRRDVTNNLTRKELVVLKLVAEGFSYEQIANRCGNSGRTIRNYMVVVRIKLNAANTPHAVAIAKDKHLI